MIVLTVSCSSCAKKTNPAVIQSREYTRSHGRRYMDGVQAAWSNIKTCHVLLAENLSLEIATSSAFPMLRCPCNRSGVVSRVAEAVHCLLYAIQLCTKARVHTYGYVYIRARNIAEIADVITLISNWETRSRAWNDITQYNIVSLIFPDVSAANDYMILFIIYYLIVRCQS